MWPNWKFNKTQNWKSDKIQKLKIWQNTKHLNWTIIKNSKFDKTHRMKMIKTNLKCDKTQN